MSNIFPFLCPAPLEWRLEWDALNREYDWLRALQACEQDATFHAEGDVWTHVRMVCEALAGLARWRSLPGIEREILFAAALLHDQAKPSCTRHEGGRITSRGHSSRGARDARRILWEMDVDFLAREQVCALVRYHQSPFYVLERAEKEARKQVFLISQTARCDLLTLLGTADMLGRRCPDQETMLERIALFEEFCREQECLHSPRSFPSTRSRFLYFQREDCSPDYLAHEDFRCEVTIISGLPGA